LSYDHSAPNSPKHGGHFLYGIIQNPLENETVCEAGCNETD
jgi:hypothetical protein